MATRANTGTVINEVKTSIEKIQTLIEIAERALPLPKSKGLADHVLAMVHFQAQGIVDATKDYDLASDQHPSVGEVEQPTNPAYAKHIRGIRPD